MSLLTLHLNKLERFSLASYSRLVQYFRVGKILPEWSTPHFTNNKKILTKKLNRDKQSSLFCLGVSNEEKKFYKICPRRDLKDETWQIKLIKMISFKRKDRLSVSATRGLHLKTFYSCNQLHNVLCQCVCHSRSLLLTRLGANPLSVLALPTRVKVTDILAYYGTELITAVKSSTVKPGSKFTYSFCKLYFFYKCIHFFKWLYNGPAYNKSDFMK